MSKVKIIFALSVLVAILPYLGFPTSLKNILYSIIGLGIMTIAYILYRDFKIKENKEKTFDNFSENRDFVENKIDTEEKYENLNEEQV